LPLKHSLAFHQEIPDFNPLICAPREIIREMEVDGKADRGGRRDKDIIVGPGFGKAIGARERAFTVA